MRKSIPWKQGPNYPSRLRHYSDLLLQHSNSNPFMARTHRVALIATITYRCILAIFPVPLPVVDAQIAEQIFACGTTRNISYSIASRSSTYFLLVIHGKLEFWIRLAELLGRSRSTDSLLANLASCCDWIVLLMVDWNGSSGYLSVSIKMDSLWFLPPQLRPFSYFETLSIGGWAVLFYSANVDVSAWELDQSGWDLLHCPIASFYCFIRPILYFLLSYNS